MKEEFKTFVKKRPELVDYVNTGDMTWQKFYEQWYLYGEDDAIWNKYKKKEETVNTNENTKDSSFSVSSILNTLKNVDMNEVKKGVNNLQKVVELLQGFVTKDSVSNASSYEPRRLFRKFED